MSEHTTIPRAARLRSTPSMTRARTLAVIAAALVGCGGGVDGPASVSASAVNEAEELPLLIASDGRINPSMPQAQPMDPGARTRSAHYALEAQARQLESDRPGEVTRLYLSPGDAVEMAVGVAHGVRAAMNLRTDAPIVVSGSDLRQAAAVVNELELEGATHVFLVTRE